MSGVLTNPIQCVTFYDMSITSLTGSSQSLVPARSRRWLSIENIGNANIGVNLAGGVAAIGGTGTFTLVPNGSILLDSTVPSNAVTVIGTTGQPVACVEA